MLRERIDRVLRPVHESPVDEIRTGTTSAANPGRKRGYVEQDLLNLLQLTPSRRL